MESDANSISEKTVEDEPASQGIRVQELWFEDGGIIVQAGSALYRVSRGILAARSSVFKSAFHLYSSPTGKGLEMMDGVPFLHLPDSERDVTHFFKAIFDSSYFEPHPNKTSFSAIVGVLRLSHKYDVDFFRQRALKHLYAGYAHGNLERWDTRNEYIAYTTEDELLEAFMVVQMAIEVDVQYLLPAAVYKCCTYPVQRVLALGSEPESADFAVCPTFSSAQALCLNTWPKIRASYHSLYGHLLTKTCIDRPKCHVYLYDNFTKYSNIASVCDVKNDPLNSLDDNYWESLGKNVCRSCFLESRKFYDKWRSDLWLELPWMMSLKSTDTKTNATGAGVPPTTLEPVVPLQVSEKWSSPDSPLVIDMIKALLNELTWEKFDSTSDQIIQWVNRSENLTVRDGRTLVQVIRLVYEKAIGTDDAAWSEMYGRLCKKMMEQISPRVQDEGIKNSDGRLISGGQLFRKHLLNRCQEGLERGRVAEEAVAASSDEVAPRVQKTKRQYPGLARFIAELFKLQMLTERIMHECIKKLLDNRREDDIEDLCKIMTSIGAFLDTVKARAHMDVYFQRMKELTQSPNISLQMQFMLQDVLILRERKWITRNRPSAPAPLAQIYEAAVTAREKELSQRSSLSQGNSRRGNQEDPPQADRGIVMGTSSRATTRADDSFHFGRVHLKTQEITTFGPSSVFASKKDTKPALESDAPGSPQQKKLMLQPRTKLLEEPTHPAEEIVTPSEEEAPTPRDMTEQAADAKIAEDVKEFFNIRDLDEAEVYFITLSSQHHHRLVDKLVTSAVLSKEPDAWLVADLFTRATDKGLCSPDAFEEGLMPTAEMIEDIVIDAPKAWTLFAVMVKGAELDEEHRTRLASRSTDSDKLLRLLS